MTGCCLSRRSGLAYVTEKANFEKEKPRTFSRVRKLCTCEYTTFAKITLKFKFNLKQYQISVIKGMWKATLLITVFLSLNFLLHLNSGIVFSRIAKATHTHKLFFVEKN